MIFTIKAFYFIFNQFQNKTVSKQVIPKSYLSYFLPNHYWRQIIITMIQKQGFQILKQKTNSLKKATRQKQLDNLFNSKRKQILKGKTKQQQQARRKEQIPIIHQLINNLKQNYPNSIFKLWERCCVFSFRYLTEQHILLLVSKLKKLSNQNLNREEQITMGVWLIVNWSTIVQNLKEDFQDLIQFLGELLEENLSAKLNQYILYSFINLCTDVGFAIKTIKGCIVYKLLKCSTLIEEAHLVLFINNCLQGLKNNGSIQQNLLSTIVNIVKRSLKNSNSDYFLRKDSFSIIRKIINITNIIQIMKQFSPQLKILTMNIESMTELESCCEMFAMLTVIAEIDSIQIDFFDHELQTSLWNSIRSLLCLPNTDNFEEQENISRLAKQIWKFMLYFIKRVGNELKPNILDWLFEQFLIGNELQCEEQALVTLLQNLEDEDSLIQLCEVKLKEYSSFQEYTQLMLNSLKKVVSSQQGVIKMKSREQLCLYLKNFNFHQNEVISLLARQIQEKLSQSEMEEQIHLKNHILQIN